MYSMSKTPITSERIKEIVDAQRGETVEQPTDNHTEAVRTMGDVARASYSTASDHYDVSRSSRIEPAPTAKDAEELQNDEISKLSREQAIEDGRDVYTDAHGELRAVETNELIDDVDDDEIVDNSDNLAISMQEMPGEDLSGHTQAEINEATLAFELGKKPPRGHLGQDKVEADYEGRADSDRGDYVTGFHITNRP